MDDLTATDFRSVCPSCGQEQVLVCWNPGPPPADPKDAEPVTAAIRWHGERPSQEEMLAMRRFIPVFRDRPMHELYAAVHGTPSWPLGTHTRSFARRIQNQAREFGLTIEIHEIVA